MFSPRAMLKAAVGYVRKNPDEVVRQAVSATGLTFGVPLATLRWFAGNLKGKKAPKDVEISSASPALRFSAVVDAMGTPGARVRRDQDRRGDHLGRLASHRDPPS